MIPFKDDNPTRTVPFVTIAFIAMNVVVYASGLLNPSGQRDIIYSYGAIPAEMLSLNPGHFTNIFASMFLHGGFFHVAGNMLYLWIFGNNIEDRLGHIRFVFFYLLCGVIAAYGHAITEPSSVVPMIGASGAVSGILGAYLLLYPRAKIHTIIFFGFFVNVVMLPAGVIIGLWALLQIVNGILSKGPAGQTSVAWFAHISGFLFGLAAIKLWLPRRRKFWN